MLSNGFPINNKISSQANNTLISLAASYNKKEIFDLLLSKKPIINQQDNNKQNILHKLAHRYSRNTEMLNALLNYDKESFKKMINAQDSMGRTPLHYAFLDNINYKSDFAMGLIQNGADFNIPDREGQTPTHFLILTGDTMLLKESVLKYNADINLKDKNSISPLELGLLHFKNMEQKEYLEKIDIEIKNKPLEQTKVEQAIKQKKK